MTLGEARHLACQAYWDAKSHEEEHAAVQRMIALGIDTDGESCPEPECVERRISEQKALLDAGFSGWTEYIPWEPMTIEQVWAALRVAEIGMDIAAITREVARGG